MSSTFDVNIVSVNIGALNNNERPLFKVPANYGGITIVSANAYMGAAGTVGLNLVDLGAAGTSVAGTIATLGSVVYVADVPQAFTVSDAYVDATHWVGVSENNTGTCNAVTFVDIAFVMGK